MVPSMMPPSRSPVRAAIAAGAVAFRGALLVAAIVLVAWSFWRVGVRELGGAFTSDEAAEVELVVMHWSGDGGPEEDAIVEDALARFEAEHPSIRVRRVNPGDAGSFYTKLQTMLVAGDPPDVFYVGAERLANFAELGLLAPLDAFVEAESSSEPTDDRARPRRLLSRDGRRLPLRRLADRRRARSTGSRRTSRRSAST